jgi:hypothetical protein
MTPPGGVANKKGILPIQHVITLTARKIEFEIPLQDLKISS